MNREQIIRMALEAGMGYDEKHDVYSANIDDLTDFVALVIKSLKPSLQTEFEKMFMEGASAEREACLKFCDEVAEYFPSSGFVGSFIGSKIKARRQA